MRLLKHLCVDWLQRVLFWVQLLWLLGLEDTHPGRTVGTNLDSWQWETGMLTMPQMGSVSEATVCALEKTRICFHFVCCIPGICAWASISCSVRTHRPYNLWLWASPLVWSHCDLWHASISWEATAPVRVKNLRLTFWCCLLPGRNKISSVCKLSSEWDWCFCWVTWCWNFERNIKFKENENMKVI